MNKPLFVSEAAPTEPGRPPKDPHGRATTIRLLHVLAAAALVLPISLFLFASWIGYRSTQALANERIERSLDVMEEEALRVFESMNLAIDSIGNMLGARTAAEIDADAANLHVRLRQILATLPEVQSLFIFGPDGYPQVISREYPAPKTYFGDQDYFTVSRDIAPGVYIGGIHESNSGGQPYFTFNRARHDADGKFAGVIEMSLLPSDFSKFYSRLVTGPGLRFALVREDGTILARFPPLSGERHLDEASGFHRAIVARPSGGFYTSASRASGVERRLGYRRIAGFDVYVTASIDTAAITREWMRAMSLHLIFGVPATLFLFGAVLILLQRTKRLYAEQDRREAAETAMRQSQKLDAIGHLTGGVAHDFNNLLTIIIGNLESAQRQLESWTEGAQIKLGQRLANAMQGAQRAATMTRRLLAFSRQQPLNPRPVDVNRLLNGLSDFLRRALGEQISLEIVGSGGAWPIEVDANELETAILNLTVNARDAMPEGGKLTIDLANCFLDEAYCRQHPDIAPGQYVQIAVTDNGTGMNNSVIERAFEPFFTTKQFGQGTGLGLSQVYGFVKQSGGHVKIYSEVGDGTTVKIYLPRFLGSVVPEQEIGSKPARGRSGECVLVVEDDAEVRAYVVETLGALGYDVLEAGSGDEALKRLEQYKTVQLLLTDVVMPGMNGRKLADAAQQLRPGLKVVFMTGYSRNAIVHQGRLDPGVALIQKPLNSEQLATAVRNALDG